MADEIPPRFRKTKNGKWAVMAPVEVLEKALVEGGKVDVQRRSGDWSTFLVASLGRPFDVDGVQMCYGYGPDEEDGDAGGSGAAPSASRSGGGDGRARSSTATAPTRRASQAEAPPPDPTEPLPEYRGGPEDEWDGGF